MELVHRLPKALLVALIAGLLGSGAVGFAVAADDDREGVPERFGVAKAHGGDLWQYDLVAHFEEYLKIEDLPAVEVSESVSGAISYEWQEARAWNDENGDPHRVRLLHEEFRLDEPALEAVAGHLVSLDDWHTKAYYERGDDIFTSGSTTSLLLLDQSSETRTTTSYTDIHYGQSLFDPFCGFHSELQGGDVQLEHGVVFHGECLPSELQEALPMETTNRFDPVVVEYINGLQTVRFRNDFELGTIDIWMARHVPYPVQATASLNLDAEDLFALVGEPMPEDLVFHANISFEMQMTGFQAGSEDIAPDIPLRGRLHFPQIKTAPRQVWGPDETGVDHPFTLRAAFEVAMAENEDFEDFVDDGAVVTAADSWFYDDDEQTEYRWRIQIDDGEDVMVVHVSRFEQDPSPLDLVQDPVSYDVQQEFGSIAAAVDPDTLPDELPTVASMMQRWDVGHAEAANHWSLRLACDVWCNQHVAVGTKTSTQEAQSIEDQINGAERTATTELEAIGAGPSGDILFERQETRKVTTREDGISPLSGMEPQVTAPEDPEPVPTTHAGVWVAPGAEAAAGVGAAAALLGVLYWLWPAIKAAPVGLFSRVHGESLLEHPVRGQMMEAIQSQPGIHYQALVRELGKGRGVVEHHMRKLQQSGFVVAHKTDGVSCFFPKGQVDRRIMATMPVLKSRTAQRILRAVVSQPGNSAGAIAQSLGIAPSTISHHMRRLESVGLIERSRSGAHTLIMPSAMADQSLNLIAS